MAEIECDDCVRKKAMYRGENLYIVVSPSRVDLSMTNLDEFRTLAGLALVERLINELVLTGWTMEGIASLAFECSYQVGDLPEILSRELVK